VGVGVARRATARDRFGRLHLADSESRTTTLPDLAATRLAYLRPYEPGWREFQLEGSIPLFLTYPLSPVTGGSKMSDSERHTRLADLNLSLAPSADARARHDTRDTRDARDARLASAVLSPELPRYDVLQHQRRAMIALLVWSGASLAAGTGMLLAEREPWTGFGIQNLAWGAIDAVIAGVALGLLPKAIEDAEDAQRRRLKFRKVLWINTGLDVVWILAGVAMVIWGNETVRAHGYGVITQGGFLFVFDGINAGLTYRR
jgi:hypothetical protein